MKKITKIIAALVSVLSLHTSAQNPVLLKDIDTDPAGSNTQPNNGVAVGSVYYFQGNSYPSGKELWKTDGTTAGTVLVKDIYPGASSSNPSTFAVVNTTIFFVADDGVHGNELWKTDGTSAGTVLVTDPYTGGENHSSQPQSFNVVGSYLYYLAYDGDNTEDEIMYKVDASGNVSVAVDPNNGFQSYNIGVLGTNLFFESYSNTYNAYALWKTDGTIAGTTVVSPIGNYYYWFPNSPFVTAGSSIYFDAYYSTDNGASTQYELWKSDGTNAGTKLVNDIGGSGYSSNPQQLTAVGSSLFFTVDDGVHGNELWVSDGTSVGTKLVNDIWNGGNGSSPNYLVSMGSNVYFNAYDGINGAELWKSDGTSAGTKIINNVSNNSSPQYLTVAGSTIYLNMYDNTAGYELYKTDGTTAGTVLVKDIQPGGGWSYPNYFGAAGSNVYFQANDGVTGPDLWTSNGTAGGTYELQLGKNFTADANPSNLTKVGNNFFFDANSSALGDELYMSDGTIGGTQLVSDLYSGSGSSSPQSFCALGSTLYFEAYTPASNNALFKSDGTSAGTVLVSNAGYNPQQLYAAGSTVYFAAQDYCCFSAGNELWKSDGTSAGTSMVKDIWSGGNSSNPGNFATIGNTVFFIANDGTHGTELWKTDGTSAGTVLVKDIQIGGGGSNPNYLTAIGSTLFFFANDGVKGQELWTSDGTAAGTNIVADIYVAGSTNPTGVAVLGSNIYFNAYTPQYQDGLWTSDGTFAGTKLVSNVYSYGGQYGGEITTAGSQVFFRDINQNTGYWSLYKSDGTSAGTIPVSPNRDCSYPQNLKAVGSLIVCNAQATGNAPGIPNAGNELWISDGTQGGTFLAADIWPGSNSSSPYNILNMNNQYVAFVANDGFKGNETWRYTTPAVINASSLGNVLCAGSNYNVTYTVTQGLLNSGNQFEVQLSDGLGSFTSPTTIGSITSTSTTGSIPATMPNNLSGLGYWVRVASTNQASIPTTQGQAYVVSAPPVVLSGDAAFCPGSSTTLTANASTNITYLWSTGATTSSISVNTAGSLSVTATDNYGCSTTKGLTITQDVAPTVSITGSTSYCIGGSTTIMASGATSYSWYPTTGISNPFSNNVTFNGSSTITYTLTATGAACSTITPVNIIVSNCSGGLGIKELTDGSVSIYPNPASESVNLQMNLNNSAMATIKLINVQGMLIYEESTTLPQGTYLKSIDLSKEAKGVYWLQVITDKGTSTNKIVLQ